MAVSMASSAALSAMLLLALATIGLLMPAPVTARCEIVSGEPRLYGRVHNKEVLPEELWFPSSGPSRNREFAQYLREHAAALAAPGGAAHPLPPSGCYHILLINDKYKVIFLKNTKTAGTSLLQAFWQCGG